MGKDGKSMVSEGISLQRQANNHTLPFVIFKLT